MSNNKDKSPEVDPRPSKKQKVSRVLDEANKNQSDDEEKWDPIPAHFPQDGVPCRECLEASATVTWVSSLTGDAWDLCDQCQIKDFGECNKKGTTTAADRNEEEAKRDASSDSKDSKGLKSSISSSPPVSTTVEDKPLEASSKTILTTEAATAPAPGNVPGSHVDNPESESMSPAVKTLPTTVSGASQDDDGDEGSYDLKKILTLEELLREDSICCSQEGCGGLPAFGLYVNSVNPQDRWYYCLDCQENDFDGWPPVEELPVKYLSLEHMRIMAQKCSSSKTPRMPVFSHSPNPNSAPIACDTPANLVTPPPPVSVIQPKSAGPAKAIEVHKKWLEAAQAMGGPDTRLVVSKPSAKKLIFDFLVNTFQPMNITQIYMGLLAVVPQPVLNACLQEMVPDQFSGKNMFDDSDDETKKDDHEKSEPYSGSLIFKPGKNLSTNLYFCDYNKIKGLDHDERDLLRNDLANATTEKESIEAILKATRGLVGKLMSEPTNEELHLQLEAEESLIQELEDKVAEARKLIVNEKHKQNTKKRIEKMAAAWRSRRRSCLDFLTSMEENSDGQISRAKCLKGDGPITIDSDEMVAKDALQYAKEKKKQATKTGGLPYNPMKKNLKGAGHIPAQEGLSSDLVAVSLDSQLHIIRIYADSLVA